MTRREQIYTGLKDSYSKSCAISDIESVLDNFPMVKELVQSLSEDVVIERYKYNHQIALRVFEEDLIKYDCKLFNIFEDYNKKGNIYLTNAHIFREFTDYYYVYALIDSTNGKIFYIGKGVNNRIFQHSRDIKRSNKVNKIKEIQEGNVHYWIIKNGLDPGMALSLESYLISKINGLCNIVVPMITFEYITYLKLNYMYKKYGKQEYNN